MFTLDEKSLKISKRQSENRKLMKDRQHNGQTKNDKRPNNDIQNIARYAKDQATQTPLKPQDELICSGMV